MNTHNHIPLPGVGCQRAHQGHGNRIGLSRPLGELKPDRWTKQCCRYQAVSSKGGRRKDRWIGSEKEGRKERKERWMLRSRGKDRWVADDSDKEDRKFLIEEKVDV